MFLKWLRQRFADWAVKRMFDGVSGLLVLLGATVAWRCWEMIGGELWYESLLGGAACTAVACALLIVGLYLRRRLHKAMSTPVAAEPPGPPVDSPVIEAQPDGQKSIRGTYAELYVAWETARRSPDNSGTADEQLFHNREWPQIKEYACLVLGHPHFDQKTWERLQTWLETHHGKRRESLHSMPQTEIVRLLRDAVAVKTACQPAPPPTSP